MYTCPTCKRDQHPGKTCKPGVEFVIPDDLLPGYCAVAFTHDGEFFDAIENVDTVRVMANEGYYIVAIANDGHYEKEEIQRIADYEYTCAIDCFGEGHKK